MSEKLRVGIFGGTFNPPHIGHVNAAKCFVDALKLDKLLIIPDCQPPHKNFSGNVTPHARLCMCELAFSNVENAEVSDIEITRGGKSYTVQTLQALSSDHVQLFLLCGTDMFLTLESWYKAEEIFKLATLCHIGRGGEEEDLDKIIKHAELLEKKYGAKTKIISSPIIQLSSTMVREALAEGGGAEYLTPSVYSYILREELYK